MKHAILLAVGLALGLLLVARRPDAARARHDKDVAPAKRVPWTTSRVTGTPEPPHPFAVERAFPKLTFKNPLLMARIPGTDRLFVGEQYGKIFSFPDEDDVARADLFFDLPKELSSWDRTKVKGVGALYGLAFHPKFAENRYCYICYVLDSVKDGEQLLDGSRVSRFTVTDTNPPRVDPKSEKVLLTFMAGGHNGGDLHFGHDGKLYVSTGDAANPNPPDALDTGQDCSDLLSSVLRIDVDRADKGLAYAVPSDNPFVGMKGVRPEIWAYGFRNPWRMSFDRATGDLWVGDVGWELWEMVYRVKKGGNYGWSVMEGRQPVKPEGKRGPTPILPPNLDFPHTEAASITGGYVYRGTKLKDLAGAYICGDWVTRKLWATKFDGDKVVWHKEIAQGTQRVVAFGETKSGELYFLNYDDPGTIHRLAPNPAAKEKQPDFPRKLSETGLFASMKESLPAPGVVPFAVNAAQWSDHATAERLVGLPGISSVKIYDGPVSIPGGFFSAEVFFPKDGVLAKTISLETERGNPASRRRLETQLLHFDGVTWRGYTYAWNEEQTDAALVPAAGSERTVIVTDAEAPGGKRKQTWRFHSRTECMTCHNPWAGHTLAFTHMQLDRDVRAGASVINQLQTLQSAGLVERLAHPDRKGNSFVSPHRLTDPRDATADLNERARSYLHANCAHCHRFGGGGTVDLELRYGPTLEQTKTLEVRPTQGNFEIANAHILSPGDPYRSVLYYRLAKLGRGRMPHIGSEVVDESGLRLVRDWIRQLPVRKDDRQLLGQLNGASAKDRAATIDRLLSSTSGALMLAEALGENRLPSPVRGQVLTAAAARTDAQVRDLFERFLPEEQRVKRLGAVIRPEQILSLKGDAARGRDLFFKSATLQCVQCHRAGGTGQTLGPDLSQVGKKLTRPQILESLLEPSKTIEPAYVAYLLETTDGKFHTGLLVTRNDKEVVLKILGDKEVRVPAAKVERLSPQSKSIMPELLLRDLTAEQAADLLEFLSGLK